jgi:hypothetical protein
MRRCLGGATEDDAGHAKAPLGFPICKLNDLLLSLDWDFVIRFRGTILVTSAEGDSKTAQEWVSLTGRARMLRGAKVTADQFAVPAVVVAWDRKMKEPWCLATTLTELTDETSDRSRVHADVLGEMKTRFEETFAKIPSIQPSGGMKLQSGRLALGPVRPPAARPHQTDLLALLTPRAMPPIGASATS